MYVGRRLISASMYRVYGWLTRSAAFCLMPETNVSQVNKVECTPGDLAMSTISRDLSNIFKADHAYVGTWPFSQSWGWSVIRSRCHGVDNREMRRRAVPYATHQLLVLLLGHLTRALRLRGSERLTRPS